MPKYHPIAHKILVRLDLKERKTEKVEDEGVVKTKSGLYLPVNNSVSKHEDAIDLATEVGTLVELGHLAFKYIEGCDDKPWVEIGDRVVFPAYAGRKYADDDGTQYRIMEDQDIFAKCDKESKKKCQKN